MNAVLEKEIRCDCCDPDRSRVMAVVRDEKLIIRGRRSGQQHMAVIPLTDLVDEGCKKPVATASESTSVVER